jgi:hypothetical protein
MIQVTLIDQTIAKKRSDVTFTEILKYKSHKLRVRIRSNSYDFQNSAVIDRWDGAKWNVVYTIPYTAMTTPDGLATVREPATMLGKYFLDDREKLVKMALKIIS